MVASNPGKTEPDRKGKGVLVCPVVQGTYNSVWETPTRDCDSRGLGWEASRGGAGGGREKILLPREKPSVTSRTFTTNQTHGLDTQEDAARNKGNVLEGSPPIGRE